MMHEIEITINELRILRVKLNRIRCLNAQDMRLLRLQYKEMRDENDQIDILVMNINRAIDTYFASVKE